MFSLSEQPGGQLFGGLSLRDFGCRSGLFSLSEQPGGQLFGGLSLGWRLFTALQPVGNLFCSGSGSNCSAGFKPIGQFFGSGSRLFCFFEQPGRQLFGGLCLRDFGCGGSLLGLSEQPGGQLLRRLCLGWRLFTALQPVGNLFCSGSGSNCSAGFKPIGQFFGSGSRLFCFFEQPTGQFLGRLRLGNLSSGGSLFSLSAQPGGQLFGRLRLGWRLFTALQPVGDLSCCGSSGDCSAGFKPIGQFFSRLRLARR